MKIIREKKFRPAVTWNRTHGRKVYNKIELLADAVGMQCFKGRLNNKANWNHPRAALKTFYISPVQMDSDSDGWGTRRIRFNSRSYDRVQNLFIECREKFFANKVDIDAV